MDCKTAFADIVIPTYETGAPEPLPIFFEKRANQGASSKIYPMAYTDKLTDNKRDKVYRAAVLENEYIRVVALPEVGGKIYSALDKTNHYDFVYRNEVIKPAMIALAGPWISGGIEFNWPLHHRPTTYEVMDAEITHNADGTDTVWMSEVEPYNRTKGMVGLTVPAGRSYIQAEVKIYNGTPVAHPFLWWANLAVKIDENSEVVFPPDVEYVNDHDRRAVLSWPIAKGRFDTARPYDYGEGVDIHHHRNIVVPSSFMISKGQCDADYICGYDSAKQCGIVALANHYISPGKKLWTWGNNDFGYKWCANLTDDGSRYVELMTGCYTDNQPDFTYIAPYETKHFKQYWYPVRDIGEVKNATLDAAVNLEQDQNGCRIGFYATGVFPNCRIAVRKDGETVFETTADLSPEQTWVGHVDCPYGVGVGAELYDACGNKLVGYTVLARGKREPIAPRQPSPRPKDIETVEELWLHGKHLVQYKHFTLTPDDYFLEGLRRDAGDARCNEAMGDLMLERGQFERAIAYYDAAQKRLELRNANPEHTDVLYKRGLCKSYLHRDADAYQDLYWSTWSYKNRSAGYYEVAALAARVGDKAEAVRLLTLSLETNISHLWAKRMLSELTGNRDWLAEIEAADALFDARRKTAAQALDLAAELMKFGLIDRAVAVLEAAEPSVQTDYYLAFLYDVRGEKQKSAAAKRRGDARDWANCNPNRLSDIEVLRFIDTPRAQYYLGCLYYDRDRYADAAACWETCVAAEAFAPAYRGLALAYYDHLHRPDEAHAALLRAFELAPESDRIFYELVQMHKSLNLPIIDRLAFLEAHRDSASRRDDCTLEYSQLLTMVGRLDEAKNVLLSHRFHTYEGGEGNLTSHHAWLQYLIGETLFAQKDYAAAMQAYRDGLVFPDCYGETKSFFVNDAPLYMGLSKCAKALGRPDEYLDKAQFTYGGVSAHSYWQILAYRAAGQEKQADRLIQTMLDNAENLYDNRDMPPYFGVGAHAFMPFQYDTEKYHTMIALQLEGFARLARGETERVDEIVVKLMTIDCGDFTSVLLKETAHA